MIRPLVLHYETDRNVRNMNDEFLIGESLLAAPVVDQGVVYISFMKLTDSGFLTVSVLDQIFVVRTVPVGEVLLSIYRKYVELRYSLLPYFYDLCRVCEQTG